MSNDREGDRQRVDVKGKLISSFPLEFEKKLFLLSIFPFSFELLLIRKK